MNKEQLQIIKQLIFGVAGMSLLFVLIFTAVGIIMKFSAWWFHFLGLT
jgi:hypothetical protein